MVHWRRVAGVPYRDLRGVPSLPRDDPVPHLAQAIRRTLLAEYGEGGARDGAAPPAVRDNSPDLPHDFESPVSSASRTHVAGQLQASLRAHLTRVHPREVLIECEALINPGLAVRCDRCTISLVPFYQLCERCKVAVEGQARDNLMWEAARPNLEESFQGLFHGTPYCNVAGRQVMSSVCRGGRMTDAPVVSGFVECFV